MKVKGHLQNALEMLSEMLRVMLASQYMQVPCPHWPFIFYLINQNFVVTALVTIKAFRRYFRGYKFCTITWARHAPTINDVASCVACTILKVQGALLKFLWFCFVIVMLYIFKKLQNFTPTRLSPLNYGIPWLRYIWHCIYSTILF